MKYVTEKARLLCEIYRMRGFHVRLDDCHHCSPAPPSDRPLYRIMAALLSIDHWEDEDLSSSLPLGLKS